MSLTTCNVICTINDDSGVPVVGAVITARLNRFEVYLGYVVPTLVQGVTDATGHVTLALWPNELGSTESMYVVKVLAPNGKSLTVNAVVPNVTSTQLHLIATLPAYTGKSDGELILTAAVEAGAVAISKAAEAVVSATAASVSAAASQVSKLASDASATLASDKATVATTQATLATTQATQSAAANAVSNAAALASANTSTAQAVISTNQATVATQQAVIATTQATNSATSASGSLASSVVATTKASQASASAVDALGNADATVLNVLTATQRAQQAANSVVVIADELDVMDIKISAANATLANSVQAASTSATNAANTAATMAATLASFRGVYLGAFASDAAAASFAVANSIVLLAGVMYENIAAFKFRIYNGTAWIDYDATAQASQSAAVLSATNAASSASTASTQAGIATTQATNAATSASSAASSLAAVAAVTTGNMSSQNANAVAVTGGAINGTTVGSATASAGSFTTLNSSGATRLGGASGNQSLQVNNVASAVNYMQIAGAISTGFPTISALGTDTDVGFNFQTKGLGQHRFLNAAGAVNFQINTQTSVANQWLMTATEAGISPLLQVTGSDADIDLRLRTKGVGAYQFDTTSNGNTQAKITNTASAVNYLNLTGAATGAAPTIAAQGSDANIGLVLSSKGTGVVALGGSTVANSALQVVPTASSVNFAQIVSSTVGFGPIISAQGIDPNIAITVRSKGTYGITFQASTGSGIADFLPTYEGFGVNFLRFMNAVTLRAPTFSAQGSDTNISLAVQSKGTGAIALAAGSSGVNISNGGTVTSAVLTATGYAHLTQSSAFVSAPTTAGGVQATLTVRMGINTAPVATGGTGYAVGDVLTIVGGTPVTLAATLTVASVSAGGVITAVNSTNFTPYSVLPSSPASVTSLTGSGATFNPLWYTHSLAVANAGSGYVEQPTITFSGGGGSLAAAYAVVGSGTTIKSINKELAFNTPGGTQLMIGDSYGTATDFVYINGSSFGRPAIGARTLGNPNASLMLFSTGTTGTLQFATNNSAQLQAQVTHTASAVNYVTLTGSATNAVVTTNAPVISAQGSDTNIAIVLQSKGTSPAIVKSQYTSFQVIDDANPAIGGITLVGKQTTYGRQSLRSTDALALCAFSGNPVNLITGGSSTYDGQIQVSILNTVSAVNYITLTGAPTNAGYVGSPAPTISAAGSDANVSLKLAGKGTGFVLSSSPMLIQRSYGGTSLLGLGGSTIFTAGTNAAGVDNDTVIDSTKTSAYTAYSTYVSTAAAAFNLSSLAHYKAQFYQQGAGSTITTQYGYFADGSLTAAVYNFGFYSNLAAAANRYNFYAAGTADNVFVGQTSLGGTQGTEALRAVTTASAVNWLQVAGAQANTSPTILAAGSDTNIPLTFLAKGTSNVNVGGTSTNPSLVVSLVPSQVNSYQIFGNSTGNNPTLAAIGTDTNVGMQLQTKGTGGYNFSIGGLQSIFLLNTGGGQNNYTNCYPNSGSLNYALGGADTNISFNFTTKGTGAFNFATGGGRQAAITDTASAVNYLGLTGAATAAGPTISAQGSDTNIDLTYSAKGTGNHYFAGAGGQWQFVISSTASAVNYVKLSAKATGGAPIFGAVGLDANIGMLISGKGTGAVSLQTGSVTQVSVSDTASAVNYLNLTGATTTNNPSISSIGSDADVGLNFYMKGWSAIKFISSTGGQLFQIGQLSGTTANYLQALGNSAGNAPVFSAQGTDTNVGLVLNGKGTGVVALGGSTAANSGLVVAPVASSVNYIQAAGVATGGNPILSAQGTNTDISIRLQGKGTLPYYGAQFENSAGLINLQICSRASSVNYFRTNPATTGNAPELSAQGSDANINIKLTPQGTGTVQFGTYTSGVLSPTGYITITDAAGTSRRLLVG